jgi:hypothetical protein
MKWLVILWSAHFGGGVGQEILPINFPNQARCQHYIETQYNPLQSRAARAIAVGLPNYTVRQALGSMMVIFFRCIEKDALARIKRTPEGRIGMPHEDALTAAAISQWERGAIMHPDFPDPPEKPVINLKLPKEDQDDFRLTPDRERPVSNIDRRRNQIAPDYDRDAYTKWAIETYAGKPYRQIQVNVPLPPPRPKELRTQDPTLNGGAAAIDSGRNVEDFRAWPQK